MMPLPALDASYAAEAVVPWGEDWKTANLTVRGREGLLLTSSRSSFVSPPFTSRSWGLTGTVEVNQGYVAIKHTGASGR